VTERTQITEHDSGVESGASRRKRDAAAPTAGSASDRVLALQRSAGNSAVAERIGRESNGDAPAEVQRAPDAPAVDSAPATSANVFREGFFSKAWKKVKGFFSKKPKTGTPVEGATTEGDTPSPDMTSKAQEEGTGGTSSESETSEAEGTEGASSSSSEGGMSTPGTGSESGGTGGTDGGTSGGVSEETSSSSSGGTESTSKTEEAEVGPIAPETKKTEPEHPSPPPLAMDLASGESVLKNAFGSMKTIVPGKIEILGQAEFQVAYDKIYGAGPYSWDKYVKPKYGSLNGFANGGVNYINTASAGLHTVVHEMLHNNCASDWIPLVGSRFNEGTTEILTQVACKKLSVDAPVCYPGESPCVQALLDAGLPLADLEAAYLNGGAKEKVADWVDANCKENWAAFKGYMEAQNWTAAKAAAAKKV
jgi:hypothetical protein